MHRKIKRFGMDGTIKDDSLFIPYRERYEKLIVDNMRESGYIPVLGMGPYFATTFNPEKNNYNFVVTAYGTFIGEKKAWRIEGIDLETGTMYPRSTPPSKSKRS